MHYSFYSFYSFCSFYSSRSFLQLPQQNSYKKIFYTYIMLLGPHYIPDSPIYTLVQPANASKERFESIDQSNQAEPLIGPTSPPNYRQVGIDSSTDRQRR